MDPNHEGWEGGNTADPSPFFRNIQGTAATPPIFPPGWGTVSGNGPFAQGFPSAWVPESGPPKLPTKRSLQKFGRDLGLAAIGFFGTYFVTNQADLGLSPEVAAAISPIAVLIYRYLRGAMGSEPLDG